VKERYGLSEKERGEGGVPALLHEISRLAFKKTLLKVFMEKYYSVSNRVGVSSPAGDGLLFPVGNCIFFCMKQNIPIPENTVCMCA